MWSSHGAESAKMREPPLFENGPWDARTVNPEPPPEPELWSRQDLVSSSVDIVPAVVAESGAPVVTGADGRDADSSSAGAGSEGISG